MSITKFIPEVWARALQIALRNTLVYGQTGIINRNYEGDIATAGDTVHIISFTDPAVRSYTKDTDITWDTLTDDERTLVVDQMDYFAFEVDNVDRRQALPGFIQAAADGASYNSMTEVDTYLSGIMAAGVSGSNPDNTLGAKTVSSADTAYNLLIDLRAKLTKANVPAAGRWCIVPTDMYSYLLKDNRFIDASASGTTEALRNGQVGRAAGFDILESQTVPEATGVFTVLAGHAIATTYAEQIVEVKAVDRENRFADGIKGLRLYGGKVVRPSALASADVTVS